MTWKKASPVLIAAVLIDLTKAFFEMFIFFGPALAGVVCTVVGSNTMVGQVVGTTAVGAVCGITAVAVGVVAAAPIEAFGIVMAMSVGLAGFLGLLLWIFMKNPGLFKANAASFIWFAGSFALSEVPIAGALPAFSITLWRLYKKQIEVEKAVYKKYQAEQAAVETARQNRTLIERQRLVATQEAQAASAEAEQVARAESEQQAIADESQGREGRSSKDTAPASGRRTSESEPLAQVPSYGSPRDRSGRSVTSFDPSEFDTLHDALSELNGKQNRTPEENKRLLRAREIMRHVSIDSTETRDPVLFAAYERARQGQKVFDGSPETRGGFSFSSIVITGAKHATTPEAANDSEYKKNVRNVG
ncbi:MAG: hypothetical protein JWN18_696 [Parcubacteria group bacterium]|nr:hypothetical protein [Parcubacteria group bacterium]